MDVLCTNYHWDKDISTVHGGPCPLVGGVFRDITESGIVSGVEIYKDATRVTGGSSTYHYDWKGVNVILTGACWWESPNCGIFCFTIDAGVLERFGSCH